MTTFSTAAFARLVGRARAKNRKVREIVQTIVETGPDAATLFQLLTAAVLLSAQIDEVLGDLDEYGKGGDD